MGRVGSGSLAHPLICRQNWRPREASQLGEAQLHYVTGCVSWDKLHNYSGPLLHPLGLAHCVPTTDQLKS